MSLCSPKTCSRSSICSTWCDTQKSAQIDYRTVKSSTTPYDSCGSCSQAHSALKRPSVTCFDTFWYHEVFCCPIASFHAHHAVPTCSLSSFRLRRSHCKHQSPIDLFLLRSPHSSAFLFSCFKHPLVRPALTHIPLLSLVMVTTHCVYLNCLSCPNSPALPLPSYATFVPTCLSSSRILPMYNVWKLAQIIASYLFEGSLRRFHVSTYQPRCRFSDFLIWSVLTIYLRFNFGTDF